jgi:hypothetical protein
MGVIIKMENPNNLGSGNLFMRSSRAKMVARNTGIIAVATILPLGYVVLGASYMLKRYVGRNVQRGSESNLEVL